MSYAALHAYCQQLPIPVSRKRLYPKLKELCGVDNLKVYKTGISTEKLLGFFVRPGEGIAGLPNLTAAAPTIVVSRSLNYCWERFVCIKEMMHLFDDELQKLGTAEEFESLITEMIGPLLNRSLAGESEVIAFWRAMGIMCPEAQRQEFHRLRDAKKITDLQIAQNLRMPELHVPSLFDPNYKVFITRIMG
ncbi:hypothetical protein [Rhodanobacter soli]|uniref:Uncharacterized protein n=1 Tax=Rhodanobacter soli TaxID=590609 RepID=A0ABV2Q098_9GAMM